MSKHKKPKLSKEDIIHKTIKTGLSAITVGIGGEIFSLIVAEPIMKRRDEWIQSIEEALKELEQKVGNFRIDELPKNNKFITTLLHASQAAIRNHQKEKLEFLRNMVLNSGLPESPAADLQLVFLNIAETFTSWHLTIMKFLGEPHKKDKYKEFEEQFPECKNQRPFIEYVVQELYNKGLINFDELRGIRNISSNTTPFGRQLLDFIRSPLSEK